MADQSDAGSGQKRQAEEADGEVKRAKRVPKKMHALVIGYVGTKYAGLQKNPGVLTIEEVLEKAIYDAGGISDDNFGNLHKVQWTRAGRTDKGVHAIGQCVALRINIEPDTVKRINELLPDDIRVFGAYRTVNSFNAKTRATGRRYEYLCPSSAFRPVTEITADPSAAKVTAAGGKYTCDALDLNYRMSPADLADVNEILNLYKGTHNFHNFTAGKHPGQESAKRYIWSFKIDQLVMLRGLEYASLIVEGQSFMLHQIRKMVGTAMFVRRFGVDAKDALEKAFSREKIALPIAPSLGLMLNQILYTVYDQQHSKSHDKLDFAAEQEAMKQFKQDRIFEEIAITEEQQGEVANWLDALTRQRHLYLIPVSAVGTPASEGWGAKKKAAAAAAAVDEGAEGDGSPQIDAPARDDAAATAAPAPDAPAPAAAHAALTAAAPATPAPDAAATAAPAPAAAS